jgi:23S rRNA (cytosine1962-C5)-methyltransferase
MPSDGDYLLIDFGAGRKLERFGRHLVDRPSQEATGVAQRDPAAWAKWNARYERGTSARGTWSFARERLVRWPVSFGALTVELKPTDSGQVGLFPEQIEQWAWIAEQVRAAERPLRVLNLFAYTGGSTLAAALAGATVTHVDAAKGAVAWARRNAATSGVDASRVRWITDDAAKFARRELQRGHGYDAVILDPPSYGHGPRGEAWKLDEHLDGLLDTCWNLTTRSRAFVLLTCHSGQLAFAGGLRDALLARAPAAARRQGVDASEMALRSAAGATMHVGACARWSAYR